MPNVTDLQTTQPALLAALLSLQGTGPKGGAQTCKRNGIATVRTDPAIYPCARSRRTRSQSPVCSTQIVSADLRSSRSGHVIDGFARKITYGVTG